MIDLTKIKRPAEITKVELQDKLAHLTAVLKAEKKSGVLLNQEGAMRWLTGVRHQIIDISPADVSPVSALCEIKGKSVSITFITAPFEMDRIKDQLPKVFKGIARIKFVNTLAKLGKTVLLPGAADYNKVVGKIVRPLIGGLRGNQYKKYDWVASMQNALVVKCAYEIEPGMNGRDVRAMMFKTFADHGLETNMLLIALKGQGNHLHPLYDERYKVGKNCWLKLVSAGRHADVIVSETLMVKFGKMTNKEAAAYAALQDATVEYADLYRNGVNEQVLYKECGKRFNKVARKYGLKGFGKSAYLHHLGGPTSPLGNRDYCLDASSSADCFAGMSFAINPVENIFGTKVEVQGIVQEEGAPHMLDISKYTDDKLHTFRTVTSENGTVCQMPEVILR